MDFSRSHRFDASVDDVYALFRDPEHARARYAALGHTKVELLQWSVDGDGLVAEIRRTVPVEVPRFARKLVKPTNVVVQTERWSREGDGFSNRWTVDVQGAPVRINGVTTLTPDGDGCLHAVEGKAECPVPILGRKLAAFVAQDAVVGVDAEHAFDQQALEG